MKLTNSPTGSHLAIGVLLLDMLACHSIHVCEGGANCLKRSVVTAGYHANCVTRAVTLK